MHGLGSGCFIFVGWWGWVVSVDGGCDGGGRLYEVWLEGQSLLGVGYMINPLRDKFFRGNINMYLHLMSFLHIDMIRVL